jgi:hypothetical protein
VRLYLPRSAPQTGSGLRSNKRVTSICNYISGIGVIVHNILAEA